MSYKIKLEVFEGPLDLLLYLVKKDHLNIYDIPITTITEQYIKYIELMQLLDLNIAGEFLVMAATLMQIKSKMLLPAAEQPQEEIEEDPRAELVRRLLEYEKFKQVAEDLKKKELAQQEIFKREKPVVIDSLVPGVPEEAYFEASIFDLINAFSKALSEIPKDVFYEVIKDEFTIENKVHNLMHLLLVKDQVSASDLFRESKNKFEVIVTFLAILELIRMKEIIAQQTQAFDEIMICRNKNNITPCPRGIDAEESEQPEQPKTE
ncbi:MAG: segregation/condensation protein A [Candidatus Omnitrophica bacterium]|jgi:segregation and condensation protein A|nr:segregation/condensation protein A [Candidatus Omnitrophota bacterium]